MPPRSSPDAFSVWVDSDIPCNIATYAVIRDSLWNWLHAEKGRLTKQGRDYKVKWITKTGVRVEAKWEVFLNWMLCACEEVKPSPEILNPFAVHESGDSIVFSSAFLDSYLEEIHEEDPIHTGPRMTESIILEKFSERPGFFEQTDQADNEIRHLDQRRNAFSEPDQLPSEHRPGTPLPETPRPE